MANRKAPIAAAILCLCFVRAQCAEEASVAPSPEQEQEIQMLRSKVAYLEDEISRRKEETSQLESVCRERTAQMATLVGELELLQTVNVADDESVMKANTNVGMLEKQIERLGNDLEDQVRKGESLEALATEAEKNWHELSRKLEHAENINVEQRKKIQDLYDRLQNAQKVNVTDDECVMKANTNVVMLEKQIERLGNDLEDQVRKGESLEARATEAEKNWHEFSRKLEHAENTNVEQRKKIQDLYDRLQNAQDKLSELEMEAKLNAEELAKVHSMWLPNWLAVRVVRCQEVASAKWQAHGKPVLGPLMQKVAEKSTYAQRLVEPHLQKAHDKLVPVAKKHLNSLRNTTTVYTSAVCRVCRDAIEPCTVKALEFTGHYWQECKTFSQPYISRIVAASEPHLSRAIVALEPYMKPVTSGWRSLVLLVSEYHHQVQNGLQGFVEDNRLLTSLPADKLAWFTASALFTLPLLSLYKISSATIRKKIQARKNRGSRRKDKRRVDK